MGTCFNRAMFWEGDSLENEHNISVNHWDKGQKRRTKLIFLNSLAFTHAKFNHFYRPPGFKQCQCQVRVECYKISVIRSSL